MVQDTTNLAEVAAFPFTSKISLKPILKAWQTTADTHPVLSRFASEVRALEQQQPELFEAFDSTEFLRSEQAQPLVELVLSCAMSCSEDKRNLIGVVRPYHFDFIYTTAAFKDSLLNDDGTLQAEPWMDLDLYRIGRDLHAYITIAKHCYELDFEFEKFPIFVTKDPVTGLQRYFQFYYDCQYLEVIKRGRCPKPKAKLIEKLRRNILELDTWRQMIRPQDYELHGFIIVRAVDITSREIVSTMYKNLTNGTALISLQGMCLFQQGVRDLLGRSDINMRILGKQGDKIFMITPDCQGAAGCLISNSRHFAYEELADSVYVQAKRQDADYYSVKDVAALDSSVPVHRLLQEEGVGSLLILPLYDEGQPVGVLQLDFPEAGVEHSADALKVQDMAIIAALGLKHSQQALEENVGAIIQEKSSIVHPAVEWRFRQAALNAILSGKHKDMEEIVFNDVYPLFSQTDIKNSSVFRNEAIEADIRQQFELARNVLRSARDKKAMPVLDEIDFRIERYLQGLNEGLRSGDEVTMSTFFKDELEPAFEQLALLGAKVHEAVRRYREALDPKYLTVHKQRYIYEQSVQRLNDSIARFLDQEQQQAQEILPHYFEKTCTDGVEMMMYLGASMVEENNFNLLYLRNLRLWQLRVTCEIARLCEAIKPKLGLPLETTHLILVQDAPMSIRFSEIERNFIVEGAYNIRYEIMKKRIDKAMVNNGVERLTQPGKIAIVYSHNKEAEEYRRYIRFLQHQGYLQEPVEDLELEVLQGLQGLRALRVTVDMRNSGLPKAISDLLPQVTEQLADA